MLVGCLKRNFGIVLIAFCLAAACSSALAQSTWVAATATTGTLTIQVGTDGDPDNFVDAQDAKTAAVLIGATGAAPVTEAGTTGVASDVLVARFTTQGSTGAPADITAGVAEVLLGITDVDDAI